MPAAPIIVVEGLASKTKERDGRVLNVLPTGAIMIKVIGRPDGS